MSELNQEWQTHESYGMAVFMRSHGTRDNLFGCGVKCNTTIRLDITSGRVQRSLSEYRYYGGEMLCSIEFSPAQFVELLTNMNIGSGIPCTIRFVNGKMVSACPVKPDIEAEKDEFKNDIAEDFQSAFSRLDQVWKLVSGCKITKQQAAEIQMALKLVRQDIEANIPFVESQFREMMDKRVTEGKAEIDAMMTHMIMRLGMDKLDEEIQKQLLTGGE